MLVRAKTRDIAIIRTMGATRRSITNIFMVVGLVIGGLGILVGSALATIFLFFRQSVVNFAQVVSGRDHDPSLDFILQLPSKTDPLEVVGIVLVTALLTFIATLFPARRAARTDPVQVLRYT
jgi:lipoprotein-releasing system permease protein